MEFRYPAEGWSFILQRPGVFGSLLFTLFLLTSRVFAIEVEELSVTNVDGEYKIRIVSIIDAHEDDVYSVITDYKYAYRINPSVTAVEVLPSDRDGVVRVRNHSEYYIGPFFIEIDWVGDIMDNKDGHIKVNTIPELSSFESGSAVWEIRPLGEKTWVLHESSLKPSFFIPPIVGDMIMKKDTLATFRRIECHAKIKLAMTMENDTELVQQLLRERKDCVNADEQFSEVALGEQ